MDNKLRIKFVIILILLMILIGNLKISNANKISMVYLYGNYDYISLVNRNDNAVNVVSPGYFDLDDNGNLSLNYVDKTLIKEMHSKSIKVTPFLSNHWDRAKGRAALSNSEQLANDLVYVINQYNLDGINIDIENVTEKDKENYIELVRLLRSKLPEEKTVSVAVAANPNNYKNGWQGSYDYEKLAQYADYLMIMAYDEHYEGGTEGSVASKSFIENSIKYALQRVPAEKIVVGLPFYGRYWKNGSSSGGYGVTLNKIQSLINEYNSEVSYDEETATARAVIKIRAGDLKPSISGRTLYEGTYTFYFENSKSIQEKIKLIKKYNLKGIGCWSLGQETSDVWRDYAKYLGSGQEEFLDINEVEWAKSAIEFVKKKGWVNGKTSEYYRPNEKLTRSEFAVIITRILELDTTHTNDTLYYDVNRHWAKNEINVLTKTGIIEGYADKSFRPDESITREEVAKILSMLIEENGASTTVERFFRCVRK